MRTRTVDEVLDMVKHGLKAARFVQPQNGFQIAKKRQVQYWLVHVQICTLPRWQLTFSSIVDLLLSHHLTGSSPVFGWT